MNKFDNNPVYFGDNCADFDVLGCAMAFIKDLDLIDFRYNIKNIDVKTLDENIVISLIWIDGNMDTNKILDILFDLISYHYGMIVRSNYNAHLIVIEFDVDFIYHRIGIYGDPDDTQYDELKYKAGLKRQQSIVYRDGCYNK